MAALNEDERQAILQDERDANEREKLNKKYFRRLNNQQQQQQYLASSRNPDGIQPQIIGGTTVVGPSVYPFFASIASGATELCGGSLVAPDLILTAAHCNGTAYFPGGRAIIDAYRLETPITGYSHVVSVLRIVQHPLYIPFHNDLMLVKFAPPVTTIQPTILNFNTSLPPASAQLTIMGFGSTADQSSSGSYSYAQTLQHATVPIQPWKQCHASFPMAIRNQHICVEGSNPQRITCAGDSGGPLMWGSQLQVGVLSYGAATCTDGPSVFTRTSRFAGWLKFAMCNLSNFRPAGSVRC